jgi:hypothetical protein
MKKLLFFLNFKFASSYEAINRHYITIFAFQLLVQRMELQVRKNKIIFI